jgi:hypothetical protein
MGNHMDAKRLDARARRQLGRELTPAEQQKNRQLAAGDRSKFVLPTQGARERERRMKRMRQAVQVEAQ